MEILYKVVLVLHLVGWAMVLGSALAGMRAGRLHSAALHGALTALVTGIIMVGLGSADVAGPDPDNVKIGVKLLVTLVITGLVFMTGRRSEATSKGLIGGIAGLTVLNIALAVLWGGSHAG